MRRYRSAKRDAHLAEVKRLHARGVSQATIARDLGVARVTVQRWLKPDFARRVHKLNADYKRSWHNAKWADGPALNAWVMAAIEPHRLNACEVRETVQGWGERERVSFWSVDRAFVALGLHVAQLPDDVWVG